MLQLVLVPGSSSIVPDGDGGGEDGLDDGGVEVHRHRLWQGESHRIGEKTWRKSE